MDKSDIDIMEKLFLTAKEKDEFEFCCTLLRVQGMRSAGWDSLFESHKLITDMLSFLETPLEGKFKLRLLLLIYCHITEMNDFYSITANLLRVLKGERYSINPFLYLLYEDRQTVTSPIGKVDRIKFLSQNTEMEEIGNIYDYMLIRQVRNAFFHSNFVLYNNEFRITQGEGVNIEGVIQSSIPLEWLMPRIEFAVNLYLKLFSLIDEHIHSYNQDKRVSGRFGAMGQNVAITLKANENGLYGFQS